MAGGRREGRGPGEVLPGAAPRLPGAGHVAVPRRPPLCPASTWAWPRKCGQQSVHPRRPGHAVRPRPQEGPRGRGRDGGGPSAPACPGAQDASGHGDGSVPAAGLAGHEETPSSARRAGLETDVCRGRLKSPLRALVGRARAWLAPASGERQGGAAGGKPGPGVLCPRRAEAPAGLAV